MNDDLISRQAAIDAICKYCEYYYNENVVQAIKDLPPAQPERKKGKFEIYVISPFDGEDCRCSECGQCGCVPYWNFCPNCGADMRGKTDEKA